MPISLSSNTRQGELIKTSANLVNTMNCANLSLCHLPYAMLAIERFFVIIGLLGNNMPREKRFRDVEFQHISVGSSSDQSLRSQQPDEPQQHESHSQYESHTQHESQSEHVPPVDCPDMDDVHIQGNLIYILYINFSYNLIILNHLPLMF